MAAPIKHEQVQELKDILQERGSFVLATYSGLSVAQITNLRREIRSKEARFKVVKNSLMLRALSESGYGDIMENMQAQFKGPVAVAFTGSNEFPAASKVLVEFSKKVEKVQVKSGCMDGAFLAKDEVEAVAKLPSKEELLAIIGRGLNTPAQQIATGMNQIIASLARGIKAVAEKNAG